MKIRTEALVASIVAAALTVTVAAGVAAFSLLDPAPEYALTDVRERPAAAARPREIGDVLAGSPHEPPAAQLSTAAAHTSTPAPSDEVAGIGSNYPGTAGWIGQATVALPGPLGGRYTGEVNGHVTVCADRCARLPVVDWCQCHWDSADRRVVDLSHTAWALVSDEPLGTGLVDVLVILEG
jgi:hypothetical protein